MMVVGLTGSIGMGKSTAGDMLRQMGVPVHDSDAAVHEALGPDGCAVAAVAAAFPGSYDPKTNSIDRKKLGGVVFPDPAKKKQLEDIIHPVVRDMQQRFIRAMQARNVKIIVLDIPLLYETGAEKRLDKVIVVSCPAFMQRQRVMSRPGMTEEKFQAILASQIPDPEKRRRADYVAQTGLGRAYTHRVLKKIIHELTTGPNHDPHRDDFPPHP